MDGSGTARANTSGRAGMPSRQLASHWSKYAPIFVTKRLETKKDALSPRPRESGRPPLRRPYSSSHRLCRGCLTGCRVTPQLDFVPFRVPQFELLAIALRPPRRPDFVLDPHALGLQYSVELVHVRRPKHQAKMIHVGCHDLPGGVGPDVNDDLGGDPRRDE